MNVDLMIALSVCLLAVNCAMKTAMKTAHRPQTFQVEKALHLGWRFSSSIRLGRVLKGAVFVAIFRPIYCQERKQQMARGEVFSRK